MVRVAWTGSALSLDEADGAWSAEYETGSEEPVAGRLGPGSGSTPTLMGTGDQDRFVVITDGQPLMHLVLMWRDEIPEDWEPIAPGKDRRIAAEVPVQFGDQTATTSVSEQSVLVRGYGAMVVNNDYGLEVPETWPTVLDRLFILLTGVPGVAPHGVEKFTWDPQTRTALSNEEVEHEERDGELWRFAYTLLGEPHGEIVVATTRPETMLGDTAVAVHPGDERYTGIVGRTLCHPFFPDREVRVIADEAVDPEFGTGAVKVTPGHDPADYERGARHGLPLINILNKDGTLNDEAAEFATLAIEKQCRRHPERLKCKAEPARRIMVEAQRLDLGVIEEFAWLDDAAAVDADGDDLEILAAQGRFELVEGRHLLDTGRAPRRPEIEEHHLAAAIGETDLLAVGGAKGRHPLGRRLVQPDQRRHLALHQRIETVRRSLIGCGREDDV